MAAENNETWSNSTETFDSTMLASLASLAFNETEEQTTETSDDQLTDVGIEEEEEEEEEETSTDGAVVVDENEVDFHNLTKPITNATSGN